MKNKNEKRITPLLNIKIGLILVIIATIIATVQAASYGYSEIVNIACIGVIPYLFLYCFWYIGNDVIFFNKFEKYIRINKQIIYIENIERCKKSKGNILKINYSFLLKNGKVITAKIPLSMQDNGAFKTFIKESKIKLL